MVLLLVYIMLSLNCCLIIINDDLTHRVSFVCAFNLHCYLLEGTTPLQNVEFKKTVKFGFYCPWEVTIYLSR